jgi:hypothetical protein
MIDQRALAVDESLVGPGGVGIQAPRLASLYLRSSASRPPLSIGLLLDEVACPRFVARIIEDIRSSSFARLDLVVLNADARPRPVMRAPFPRRLWRLLSDRKARTLLLYDLYLRLDGKRPTVDDPLALVDCGPLLAGVDSIEAQPIVKGFTHRFSPGDLELIRARRLDVLLRFGFNIVRGEILESARHGVWSFHHDDNDHYRGGPAGFWELYEGNPLSGVMLQVLTEELDAGLVLCKSRFATASGLSLAANRHAPYWGSTHFVIKKLHELHQDGWEHVRSRAERPAPYRGQRPTYKRPTNGDMTRFLARRLSSALRRLPGAARRAHWRLGIRVGARPLHAAAGPTDLAGFSWMDCPPGHAYAEPFLTAGEGATWVFFRDFSYAASRAVIACAEVLPQGRLGPARACLDPGRDLSYPMVFDWDGEAFMIPGSPAGGAVELYRATRFPYEWTRETTLARLPAVNTTVWRADDRWWFFVAVAEPRGHCAALLLFHAASLTGSWVHHPANPISSDVRSARGAGAVFTVGERRIRPGQDCRPGHGHRFTLNEIVELSGDAYRERPLVVVDSARRQGFRGTHTYTHWAGIEMVDGAGAIRRLAGACRQGVDDACVASRE